MHVTQHDAKAINKNRNLNQKKCLYQATLSVRINHAITLAKLVFLVAPLKFISSVGRGYDLDGYSIANTVVKVPTLFVLSVLLLFFGIVWCN